ncbi:MULTISPECIES: sensor histidine kinase KdpD [Streptacidiphilus]|uniref:histidine kinase n=1 Tax=Streptacidiphilus cavernicola TaxID=3342716 RepID=A0ABV6USV4_9ACTN|nr:ATP-binding protein [Streptacidiphilus jeojiense]
MSVQMSSRPPDVRRRSKAWSWLVPPLAAVLAGAVCAWVTARAGAADRVPVACFGAAAALLLGAALTLALLRSRSSAAHRARLETVRAEAERSVAEQAAQVGQAASDAQAARHDAWNADAERQRAAAAETAIRAALDAEKARSAALEAEIGQLVAQVDQFVGEAEQLTGQAIPQAVKQLREGVSMETVLAGAPGHLDETHQQVLRTLVQEVGTSERLRASGMAACANAAGRVQALATSMLADLREMENRHNEEVLGDLLRLDHGTAQAGRLADSIAVLTGARSGRRWTKPIVMESVLRGAMGRISAYQRVRLHSASTAAVAGYAAEGVMHALAELMDNATSFSPPTEEVHVYVQEMHSGVVVTIEDGGLVMPAATLAKAERLVSAEPLDLMTLGGTRLGLAVVGCLARKHGLTVSFRPSSRGGTGVVVLIPQQLIMRGPGNRLTTARESVAGGTSRPASTPAPARVATAAPATTSALPVPDDSALELPKRPPGRTLAAALRSTPAVAPTAAEDVPSRADAGARFGAFRTAARGGSQDAAPAETEPTETDRTEEDTER